MNSGKNYALNGVLVYNVKVYDYNIVYTIERMCACRQENNEIDSYRSNVNTLVAVFRERNKFHYELKHLLMLVH